MACPAQEKTLKDELQLHLVHTYIMHIRLYVQKQYKTNAPKTQFKMTEGITPRVLLLTIKAL